MHGKRGNVGKFYNHIQTNEEATRKWRLTIHLCATFGLYTHVFDLSSHRHSNHSAATAHGLYMGLNPLSIILVDQEHMKGRWAGDGDEI